LIDVETRLPRDAAAAALVDRIIEEVKLARYDTDNPRTRNRMWIRLGLAEPLPARSDADELVR
jgi:PleD family two-component response regulator